MTFSSLAVVTAVSAAGSVAAEDATSDVTAGVGAVDELAFSELVLSWWSC